MAFKRGKLPVFVDANTPAFSASYLKSSTAISSSIDYTAGIINWLMLGNDTYGDCAWAAIAHAYLLWTANSQTALMPDETCTLDNYALQTGFSAGPPIANDNGTVLLYALQYWMKTGIAVNTTGQIHKLGGFATLDYTNLDEIKLAVEQFGCVYVGVNLPDSAETETTNGQPWADVSQVPTGGHCVLIVGFDDATQMFKVITWGQVQLVTYAWWLKYGCEAYAVLSRSWVNPSSNKAPSGLTMEELDGLTIRMHGGVLGTAS